ncbi:hypothetical protein BDP27DRAFT_1320516 [Rhodocollybia butyracea]|uniref:Uncharacterized protein n=1 Tax=Rhodocollybia butyracea TaxID=206335 RepID=A0A9P5Q1T5_9AGAR|nr:hypothetical protein BDP27DRAFT_1320516 [Rhodocollybia butyracea]
MYVASFPLPFPSLLIAPSETLNRPGLLDLCKTYALGVTGNMVALRAKLTGFSEDMVRWKDLVPGAWRSHRGVREGKIVKPTKDNAGSTTTKKLKKLKLSVIRRNELMGLSGDGTASAQVFATERSKDMRTLEEKRNLLRLAKSFCDAYPYIPPDELARRVKAEAEAKQKTDSSAMLATYMQSTNDRIDSLASMLTHHLPALRTPGPISPTSAIAPMTIVGMSDMDTHAQPKTPGTSELALPVSVMAATAPEPQPAATSHSSCESIRTYAVMLAGTQALTFTYNDIPDPRQISFADDIPRLDRVWDDERANWDASECSKLLVIKGTPVALRYWPDVYRNKNDQRWKGIKATWTEWKYVAERYRASTPEEFWMEFSSDDGKRFNWKAITACLRGQRAVHDQELCTKARSEYGTEFETHFSNRGKVMTDKSAIARRYLMLKENQMDVD